MPTDLTPIIQQELDAEGVPHFDLASKIAVAISLAIQGWRPPAQVITSEEELDRLPKCSLVVDQSWAVWQAQPGSDARRWATIWGSALGSSRRVLANGSVTLVWSPTEKADTE